MTATPSTMLALGTPIPAFRLPDLDGRLMSPDDVPAGRRAARGLHLSSLSVRSAHPHEFARVRDANTSRAGSPSSRSTRTTRSHFPTTARRDAAGSAATPATRSRTCSTRPRRSPRLSRRLHARLLPLRRGTHARLPRPVRRQPPRQRHAGHRQRPARRRRRVLAGKPGSRATRRRASAATSSGSPATSRTTARCQPRGLYDTGAHCGACGSVRDMDGGLWAGAGAAASHRDLSGSDQRTDLPRAASWLAALVRLSAGGVHQRRRSDAGVSQRQHRGRVYQPRRSAVACPERDGPRDLCS